MIPWTNLIYKEFSYPIYPRDSRLKSDREFLHIDNGSQGGSHWTCFIITGKKS